MCDRIIRELNKKILPNSKEQLLVKYADSSKKKKPRMLSGQRSYGGHPGSDLSPRSVV